MKTVSTLSRFGALLAIRRVGTSKHRSPIWVFQCDCGNMKEICTSQILQGRTKSCGCGILNKNMKGIPRSHGLSILYEDGKRKVNPLYLRWQDMRKRCYNPKNKEYSRYGARGIYVCEEWKQDFKAFYNWAIENGWDKSLTLDRKNYNGPYSPENCRWVDRQVQANNRRSNRTFLINGEKLSLAEISRKYEVKYYILQNRLRAGMPIEQALKVKLKSDGAKEEATIGKRRVNGN